MVNAEDYKKKELISGKKLLGEFVIDKTSITVVKRRNEQDKRWEKAK